MTALRINDIPEAPETGTDEISQQEDGKNKLDGQWTEQQI